MQESGKFTRGWCSPERYIQGPGEFDNIKNYTDLFGTKIVFFIDDFLYDKYERKLNEIYESEKYNLRILKFKGEVTRQKIQKHVECEAAFLPDMGIGIGGGKTIDVAKAVGVGLGKPFIIIPTIAATDAPSSSLSVIYREDGGHEGEIFYNHSPSLLIVDSKIIAEAPVRFLVSGMGDALATLIEAEATRKANVPNLVYHKMGGYRQTLAGRAIARACYKSLMKNGVMAKEACEKHVVTEALENIIETNILLSGLGFENNATAGAHSINDGITSLTEGNRTMHGEKVAFGCIVQLVAENAPEEQLEEVIDFCLRVGLPVCLEDLYVENTEENICKIAEASMHSCWENMPFDVNKESICAAITVADTYGRNKKSEYGKKN